MVSLKEAAYIIGSLGGRPRKYVYSYRGGHIATETFRLQFEDGSGFLLLEDGISYLLLENAP